MGKDGDKQPKPEEVAAAISDGLDSWIPAEGDGRVCPGTPPKKPTAPDSEDSKPIITDTRS
jgi:hypothetical protein